VVARDLRGTGRVAVGRGAGRLAGRVAVGEGATLTGAGGVTGVWSRWTGRNNAQLTAATTAIAAAAASTRGHVRARAGRPARCPRSTRSAPGTMPSAALR
jgi:hypothetical protein